MSLELQNTATPARESPEPLLKETIGLLGGSAIVKGRLRTHIEVHEVIVKRLSGRALTYMVKHSPFLKRGDVSSVAGVSVRTTQRYAVSYKLLSREQSGRLWKFAHVLAIAIEVFGNREEAEKWLDGPVLALDGKRPLDLFRSPVGVELVEQLLGRIKNNVYT